MTREEKLGRAVTALVHVPESRLDLVRDFALKLAGKDGAEWDIESERYLRKEPSWIKGLDQVPQVVQSKLITYTRRIFSDKSIIIDATDGTITIPDSAKFFRCTIENRSGVVLDVKAQACGPVKVGLHEQIFDGNFSQIFGNLGGRFFTQHQVFWFVDKRTEWLLGDGNKTLLPFMVGEEKLVAVVCFYDNGIIDFYIHRLSYDRTYKDKDSVRIVVPQPEPLTPSVS